MTPHYFIAALPVLTNEFYEAIESLHCLECYPEIRLPFHATLYFFGEITEADKSKIKDWMESKNGTAEEISASIQGINFFAKEAVSTSYYLELESPELCSLNAELEIFSYIYKDSFSYLPHISLFFPKLPITKADQEKIAQLFADKREIKFKGIYLGSVVDNITRIHKFIEFKEKI